MKRPFTLLLLIPLWISCHPGDSSEFGIKPGLNVYEDNGPVLKKSYCGDSKCSNPGSEDRYSYDTQGNLSKIENFGRVASGNMEIYSYTDYTYNEAGLLTKKIQFGKQVSNPGWVPYYEYVYEYEKDVLVRENTYSLQFESAPKTLSSSTTFEFTGKMKMGQRWFDSKNNLLRRVKYDYNGNTIIRETWYNGEDIATRIFQHTFAGTRRQIAEYVPGSKEQIALVERTYNAQGLLTGEETKVFNVFICAMMPGIIRFSY
jgi:hypothetical protein